MTILHRLAEQGQGASGSMLSFGVLKVAQALGDRAALLDGGRSVLQLRCPAEEVDDLIRDLAGS